MRRLGGLVALVVALAAGLLGCAVEEDRRGALIDGLIEVAAADEPVEAARARSSFERPGRTILRRLEIARGVLDDGHRRETIEIEVEPRDCVTPTMIRDRTGIAYRYLPGGPPPLMPPLLGSRRVVARPQLPSPGIEFAFDTGAHQVVLAIAGNDLKPDACVWSFTLRRIAQE